MPREDAVCTRRWGEELSWMEEELVSSNEKRRDHGPFLIEKIVPSSLLFFWDLLSRVSSGSRRHRLRLPPARTESEQESKRFTLQLNSESFRYSEFRNNHHDHKIIAIHYLSSYHSLPVTALSSREIMLNLQAEITIDFFESNTCCDSLTVYDGLFGSNILKT